MTDPKEFFEKLMADPDTTPFLNNIKAKAESYGEDKDQFLNFTYSAMASWYSSMETMIAYVETLKTMIIMNSLEQGALALQDTIRKADKSEAARPV